MTSELKTPFKVGEIYKMTHDELIAALIEATGPRAKLDKAIAELLGVKPFKVVTQYSGTGSGGYYVSATGSIYNDRYPEYTGSLDATVQAIKAKWPESEYGVFSHGLAFVTPRPYWSVEMNAKTAELALCAAFVAALAAALVVSTPETKSGETEK